MKLDETNAKFAVVRTAFHNGGTISFHNSLEAAIASQLENASKTCSCGCCGIVPITEEAQNEIVDYRDRWNQPIHRNYISPPALYESLEYWDAGRQGPYELCK